MRDGSGTMKLMAENLRIEPALTGGCIIRFETTDMRFTPELLHKYDGKKMKVDIKEDRKGRSLDANAYCWVLCDKIASTKGLLLKKMDVYKQAIRDYGVTQMAMFETEKLPQMIQAYKALGYGNDVDVIGKSHEHPEYTFVRVFLGSSQYDTKEMSVFLDGIIADAQELGIETATPDEIEKLKTLWGG